MKLTEVKKLIEEYQEKYRHTNLAKFDISSIYDLFPDKNTNKEFQKWSETYQHNGRYGVYLIMNDNFEIIYVGESNNIGKRLGNYFGYDSKKDCLIKQTWSEQPRYICTIAIDNETWFERLALEEYLIYHIQPIDNVRSK